VHVPGALHQRGVELQLGGRCRVVDVERVDVAAVDIPHRLLAGRRDQLVAGRVGGIGGQPAKIGAADAERRIQPEDAREGQRRAEMRRRQREEAIDRLEPRPAIVGAALQHEAGDQAAHGMADQHDAVAALQPVEAGGELVGGLEIVEPPVIGELHQPLGTGGAEAELGQLVLDRLVKGKAQDLVDHSASHDTRVHQLVDALVAQLGFEGRRRPDLLGIEEQV
jgi:hypothetical protein